MFSDSGDKLPALPPTIYPRSSPTYTKTPGYYLVLLICVAVCVYLIWFALRGHLLPGTSGFVSAVVAIWALVEAIFGVYYQVLARRVQPVAPPSAIKPEDLSDLFLRVLHAGLAYSPSANRYVRDRAAPRDAPPLALATPAENGVAGETLNTGQNGPPTVERRKRGRLYSAAADTLDIAEQYMDPSEEEDPLFDERGNPHMLAHDDPLAVEFREHLRTWFHHAAWDSICAEDVLTWLAWSTFNEPLEAVRAQPKKNRFLDRTLTMLEARTGGKFPPGRSSVQICRLTLDRVNVVSRPFVVYAVANSVNWLLRTQLYPSREVQLYREGEIDYLLRIPPGWTPEKGRTERNAVPVVYLHGLGFGLLQNHLLINHLIVSLPTHPLLVPIAYHTAQGIFDSRYLKPWTRPQLVAMMRGACARWGFFEPGDDGPKGRGGISLLSHSNGSVHHGWVLKDAPEMVRRSCFVDPVVFSLWEGDVCFNFVYRKPTKAIELGLYYFVASEVGIANYIQRHFNWCDNTLFVEEIPNAREVSRSAIFLGGEDVIVDATRARRYLERNGVTTGLHWDADAGHGDGLIGKARDRVVMYVGTGSTRGWQGWITRGRRSHSLGRYDRPSTPLGSDVSDTEGGKKRSERIEPWKVSRDHLARGLRRRKTGL
ncbi:hypothetical protein CspeluHIS016_0206390 [Cutaneotrichosporon spelunceum]|uniref:Alpha/beta-hydrolase n=1 Tax=Cutaneotrichosporon spelunceum TaxID=1672016 RepID=A0AAD3YB05_9TREE|nr:hypothetical protein CspeluHIS016_0206390 [Cutaneotrichosporon spelunceum]